jgi:hypothetical protein
MGSAPVQWRVAGIALALAAVLFTVLALTGRPGEDGTHPPPRTEPKASAPPTPSGGAEAPQRDREFASWPREALVAEIRLLRSRLDLASSEAGTANAESARHAFRSTQAVGETPINPPPELPPRFTNARAIRDLWMGRLRRSGSSTAEPVVTCDEYPCIAMFDGAGDLRGLPLDEPYGEDQVDCLVSLASEPRETWTVCAIRPSGEPPQRVEAIRARLTARFRIALQSRARATMAP